ncbi:RNA polymerase sigma factor [Pedobacter insulae]|nr:sigma-70 family RNA polymerase sigma factor [Pedobacter insulae]
MSVSISNKATFDRVFLEYHKPLCLFSMRYLKSIEDSEEVVQSVFLKLYEKDVKLSSDDEMRLFLYKSVYNACLNFLRAKVRKETRDKAYFSALPLKAPPPLYDILQAELVSILQKELAYLPKIQADVIRMCYFEELSNEEVAKVLKLSLQTVKNYKNLGLKKIRNKFPKGSQLYGVVSILLNLI